MKDEDSGTRGVAWAASIALLSLAACASSSAVGPPGLSSLDGEIVDAASSDGPGWAPDTVERGGGAGDPCTQKADCGEVLVCRTSECGGDELVGVCSPAGEAGDCCSVSAPCKPGVHCNGVTGVCDDVVALCGACEVRADCAAGLTCGEALHVCVPKAKPCDATAIGAAPCGAVSPASLACTHNEDCPPRWHCDGWSSHHCVESTPSCGAPGWGALGSSPEGSKCWHNHSCAEGLVCQVPLGYFSLEFEQVPAGRCARVVEPGAECLSSQVCPPGTTCDGGHCVSPTSLSPCSCDSDCAPGAECELRNQPDADGVCLEYRDMGSCSARTKKEPRYSDCMDWCACDPLDEACPLGCAHFTACEEWHEAGAVVIRECGRCIHPDGTVPEGERCTLHAQCGSGLVCARGTSAGFGWCLPPQGVGAVCVDDCTCGAGLVCNDSLEPAACAPPSPVGGPCAEDGDCLEGLICNDAMAPAACAAPGAPGSLCAEDEDCLAPSECGSLTPRRCIPAGDAGARCSWPGGCNPGLLCKAVAYGAPTLCAVPCESEATCEPGMKCIGDGEPPYAIAWCRYPKQFTDGCSADSECEHACEDTGYCGYACW